jgi:hypothetical protein
MAEFTGWTSIKGLATSDGRTVYYKRLPERSGRSFYLYQEVQKDRNRGLSVQRIAKKYNIPWQSVLYLIKITY